MLIKKFSSSMCPFFRFFKAVMRTSRAENDVGCRKAEKRSHGNAAGEQLADDEQGGAGQDLDSVVIVAVMGCFVVSCLFSLIADSNGGAWLHVVGDFLELRKKLRALGGVNAELFRRKGQNRVVHLRQLPDFFFNFGGAVGTVDVADRIDDAWRRRVLDDVNRDVVTVSVLMFVVMMVMSAPAAALGFVVAVLVVVFVLMFVVMMVVSASAAALGFVVAVLVVVLMFVVVMVMSAPAAALGFVVAVLVVVFMLMLMMVVSASALTLGFTVAMAVFMVMMMFMSAPARLFFFQLAVGHALSYRIPPQS